MDNLSIEPGDDGLALKPPERNLLTDARYSVAGGDAPPAEPELVVEVLECLGRIRADRLANFVNGSDAEPLDEVRHRIRLAVERVTRTILNEDDRLRFEHTIALRNLTGSYVALGGDLELEAQVSGAEYARVTAEREAAYRTAGDLTRAVDALLNTIHGHASAVLIEVPALEDVRIALTALAELRGRA